MAVTTIDGVNKIQIRNAKNGDFDLNFATGGGSGGESKPFYPILETTTTYDENFNPISTETQIIQGMCINCITLKFKDYQPSSDQSFEGSYLVGVVQVVIGDSSRYIAKVGEEGAFSELKINEETNEITEVVDGEFDIQFSSMHAITCEKNKVYSMQIDPKFIENGSSMSFDSFYLLSPYDSIEATSNIGYVHRLEFGGSAFTGYLTVTNIASSTDTVTINTGTVLGHVD